jgi:hypothetical protein
LCWSLTDQWVWQEGGSNTCKGWVLVLWSIWRLNANCTSRNPEIRDCIIFCVITFVKNNEQKEIYGHQPTHQYKWCYQLLPDWFTFAKMMLVEKLPSWIYFDQLIQKCCCGVFSAISRRCVCF